MNPDRFYIVVVDEEGQHHHFKTFAEALDFEKEVEENEHQSTDKD